MIFAALAALGLACFVAMLGLGVFGLHATLIAAFGALAPPKRDHEGAVPAEFLHIALLVVAHDEERVLAASLASLLGQDYPKDARQVFVVADRCTDRTASIARAAGATVFERQDGPEGKSAAVAFGVERIARAGTFDAVAVFDADSVVTAEFSREVAARLARGERAVQGFVDAKNPGASWVSASSALGFWAIAALVQGPRERLGLSTPPMGTGFVLRLEDATRFLARAESLTDDLELSALLALAFVRVAYEPAARVLDEKPIALGTAVSQRTRWMRGRWSVAQRYVPELVRKALTKGTPLGVRLRLCDAAVQLLAPSLSFVAVALFAMTALVTATTRILPDPFARFSTVIPVEAWLVSALAFYAIPAFAMARFRPSAFVWACYLVQPAYLILSAPLALLGFLTRGARTWRRTEKG